MDTNIITLNPSELIKWCRQRKKAKGISNADIAEKTGVPMGTLDRVLSGNYLEFKYSSIQPILTFLLEVDEDTPQPEDVESEQEQYYYNTIEGYKLVLKNKNHQIDQLKMDIEKMTQEIVDLKKGCERRATQIDRCQETILKMQDTITKLMDNRIEKGL